jgi:hypothetical protein
MEEQLLSSPLSWGFQPNIIRTRSVWCFQTLPLVILLSPWIVQSQEWDDSHCRTFGDRLKHVEATKQSHNHTLFLLLDASWRVQHLGFSALACCGKFRTQLAVGSDSWGKWVNIGSFPEV